MTRFLTTGIACAVLATAFGLPADATTPTTCAIPTACAVFQNTSTGPAEHSQSTSGIATRATSSSGIGLYGSTSSGIMSEPAIEGESLSPSSTDVAGAFGLAPYFAGSTPPSDGVFAFGLNEAVFAITGAPGSSTTSGSYGVGVIGFDPARGANSNFGSAGIATGSGIGVLGEGGSSGFPTYAAYGSTPVGVYAIGRTPTMNSDIAPAAPTGIGVFVEADDLAISAHNTGAGSYLHTNTPTNLVEAAAPGGSFTFDDSGNEVISGSLTTAHSTVMVTKGSTGASRASYGSHATAPQMEDDGQATILGGRGYVRIDAALRDVIDQRNAYLVFLTPEGDCNGLFVSRKSADGFEIHELRGGRSSIVVDYRIVAKPLGENGQRLASVAPLKAASMERDMQAKPQRSHFETPLDRLRARLGPAGFAKAVLEVKQRFGER